MNKNFAYTLIGIQKIEYTRKSDGKHVDGVNLYFVYETPGTEGSACGTLYLSRKSFDQYALAIGDLFIPVRDAQGRLQSIFKLS